ncbi:hypothetical protein [Pseudarthrobacter defluvii]|uniref:hypothetical protein n=1 Tax=Pseudarthrobacter defluvii TaxID=410837 RepID=UPI00257544AB|nr:hypothetical protein [Pseudarthrobacter defluvii]WJH23310.1 hypothetical protein JCQ34_12615 [Pseudarthrobacter defluvii]
MTMVSNRSELSLSRTGIHGGIRRGTAAAAVGAVLVLSTGVQAALADDAVSPPQDPPVQASAAASAAAFGLTIASGQGTPGQQEAKRGDENGAPGQQGDTPAGTPATRAPRTPSPSISLPGTLLPVITGSASASTTPSPSPTTSGTPLAPGPQTTAPAAPTGTGSALATVRPGSPSAPGGAPAAGTSNAAGAPGQAPVAVPPAGAPGTGAVPGGDPASGAASSVSGAGARGPAGPGILGADGNAAGQQGAIREGTNGAGSSEAEATPAPALPIALPTALSINARQSLRTRAPQAAGAPAGPGQAVSSTGPLPDVPDAMIWLGAGLVGVGAAAGLVFLRMRRL